MFGPNISGKTGYEEEGQSQIFSGPFRATEHYTAGSFDGLTNQYHIAVRFDASYGSSIYGYSGTVQPPAMAALPLIKT